MNGGYWEGIPIEYMEEWRNIFANSREGRDLSVCCPVCHNKELHRYYQVGKTIKLSSNVGQYMAKGAEWQWCSYCRIFEHAEVLVPDWWIPDLEIEGDKLTAIPEILDMAYQDEKRVNKWGNVPEQYLEIWDKIFSKNYKNVVLNEKCPVCNQKMLRQYYALGIPKKYDIRKKNTKDKAGIGNGVRPAFGIGLAT